MVNKEIVKNGMKRFGEYHHHNDYSHQRVNVYQLGFGSHVKECCLPVGGVLYVPESVAVEIDRKYYQNTYDCQTRQEVDYVALEE